MELNQELNQQIRQAAMLIEQANKIVAMTGAGISTPSGIPDFRSAESGLWTEVAPLNVASIHAFRKEPQRFYQWIHPLAQLFLEAEPNPAHFALAELERQDKLKAVITQNIDNLHRKAGSKVVYELHGHLREVICVQCYQVRESQDLFERFVYDNQVPRCECGGVFKPNAVLFGEQLPMDEFVAAKLVSQEADLMLIIGSSLEVAPASDLPEYTLENDANLIIVNQRPTYLDAKAELVIRADVADVLPRIVDAVTV